jgi:hypothetical protein
MTKVWRTTLVDDQEYTLVVLEAVERLDSGVRVFIGKDGKRIVSIDDLFEQADIGPITVQMRIAVRVAVLSETGPPDLDTPKD